MRRATVPWFLLLLPLGAPAFADEIVLTSGEVLQSPGIKEATPEKVTFKLGGSTTTRLAEEVERILPFGDRNLDRAIRLLKKGEKNLDKLGPILERAIARGEDFAKPCARFFLAELYEQSGKTSAAVAAYDEVAKAHPGHFYAPIALQRAARLLPPDQALSRYERLASGKFGQRWKEVGSYGRARHLLAQGDAAGARKVFSSLRSARDKQLRDLAACGLAHCDLLSGKTDSAQRAFRELAGRAAGAAARGYAYKGLGDCLAKAGKEEPALLAYLRSVLLYPSNPERANAAEAGAKLLESLRLGGAQRFRGMRGAVRHTDYAGKTPDAELMRRTLQLVSAAAVQKFAPELEKKASSKGEQAELAFLGADAMKVVARATNDPDLLAEYEQLLKRLRKKYPNHSRAALASVDAFMAAKDRALALIAQANEEGDPAKKKALLEEGRETFQKVLEPFKKTIAAMTKEVDALLEEGERRDLTPEEEKKKNEKEFQRDLSEFLLAEAYASYARTFGKDDPGRKKNFEEALKLYEQYIDERGNFQKLLFYSYLGRGEMLTELGKFDDAVMQYEELSLAEPLFLPRDPAGQKAVWEMVKDVIIRAYYGWVRALLLAGRAPEAYKVSQAIDENPKVKGWQDHPVGILLTFERAKALAGSGRGARGAAELFRIIRKAREAPESEKIPALGMSRIGAGACRALSELSDLTGGEIYSPEIQYYVGVGYFLRGEPDLAVAGYKGVLTAARDPEERREWVPKAVREIGNMLFQQERYLEAALAYETVVREFPDHESAEEAVRYAVAASKKAIEQFKEDPTDESGVLVQFARRIEQGAGSAAGELYEQKLILKNAKDLQIKQRWANAAAEYERIKPEYTNKDGKKLRVSFYANSIANAGYCYFQAYKESKNKDHLERARKALRKATEAARSSGDRESEALACYYLGQLENNLGDPDEALKALAPFDRALASTTKYIVRARYQQALAYFKKGDVAAAEAAFRKVKDKTSDPAFGQFAYTMASKLRSQAGKLFNKKADVDGSRTLRRKAAKYVRAWADSIDLAKQREPVVFWVADTLFQGGDYRAARKAYEVALKTFQRPKASELKERKQLARSESFDEAELNLGYALVMLGELEDGFARLQDARNTAYVYRGRGDRRTAVGWGRFRERRLEGPFRFKRAGRTYQEKVWFTLLDLGGKETKFFDARPPRGQEQFFGIEGKDPSKSFDINTDMRTIELPYRGHYFVVDGRARAAWGLWEEKHDKNFLANEVTSAANELVYVLRGMEGSYPRIAARSQIEPVDFDRRLWEAETMFLKVKMARENWRGVASDLRLLKLRGRLDKAPPDVREELERMLEEAERKGGK
ncbi:MAG: hypothetical protein D6731_00710 [Planctomycetota bacterium]|nr:MAG: hypothetical protein D6731_00710 [Planctomycetota bacterium]